MESAPSHVRVMSYNILMDELSSNFVPRTMEDPTEAILAEVFEHGSTGLEQWKTLKNELNSGYAKWHPLKTMIETPDGSRIKARGLWGEPDLLQLGEKGWKLDGVEVQDAVTLDGNPTFLGIVRQSLSEEKGALLYNSIRKVQLESRAWEVRGVKILEKVVDATPTLVAFQEYDVHDLPMPGGTTFADEMSKLGYEGANFLGPGQEKSGVGMFWLSKVAKLVGDDKLPAGGFVASGLMTAGFGNLDMQEPGFEKVMDRRPLVFVNLIIHGQPVCFCGTHLMTGSRDKSGAVRSQELVTIRQFLGTRVPPGVAVCLAGDFNINSHRFADEHIWKGDGVKDSTGYVRTTDGDNIANRFVWERSDGSRLHLRDSFDHVYGSDDCSSTRTGTRLETIDYIFYDEDSFGLIEGSRSDLRCPDESMPNATEPSDHIPIYVSFNLSKSAEAGIEA